MLNESGVWEGKEEGKLRKVIVNPQGPANATSGSLASDDGDVG